MSPDRMPQKGLNPARNPREANREIPLLVLTRPRENKEGRKGIRPVIPRVPRRGNRGIQVIPANLEASPPRAQNLVRARLVRGLLELRRASEESREVRHQVRVNRGGDARGTAPRVLVRMTIPDQRNRGGESPRGRDGMKEKPDPVNRGRNQATP